MRHWVPLSPVRAPHRVHALRAEVCLPTFASFRHATQARNLVGRRLQARTALSMADARPPTAVKTPDAAGYTGASAAAK